MNIRRKTNYQKLNKKGSALMFVFLIIGFISLFLVTIYSSTLRNLRQITNYVDAKKAYYLAEAGLEHSFLELNTPGISEDSECENCVLDEVNNIKFEYDIERRVKEISGSLKASENMMFKIEKNNFNLEVRVIGGDSAARERFHWKIFGKNNNGEVNSQTEVIADDVINFSSATITPSTSAKHIKYVPDGIIYYHDDASVDDTEDFVEKTGYILSNFISEHKENYLIISNLSEEDIVMEYKVSAVSGLKDLLSPYPNIISTGEFDATKISILAKFDFGRLLPVLDFVVVGEKSLN